MAKHPGSTKPAKPATLYQLSADVRDARARVATRRIAPVDKQTLKSARDALLKTMEAYADELTAQRLPIPRRLRDDLRLLRRIRRERLRLWPL